MVYEKSFFFLKIECQQKSKIKFLMGIFDGMNNPVVLFAAGMDPYLSTK
jgi:hypothetical protein